MTIRVGPSLSKRTSVTPDWFRGPLRGEENGLKRYDEPAARWTPEPVRGDGARGEGVGVPRSRARHVASRPNRGDMRASPLACLCRIDTLPPFRRRLRLPFSFYL